MMVGSNSEIRIPMMAITTSNSTRVKPLIDFLTLDARPRDLASRRIV
jgi:hypothetical protein